MVCGYCKKRIEGHLTAVLDHMRGCEARNPWAAYFRAPSREEMRRILMTYCGLKTPRPMPEDVKVMLRDRAKSGAARVAQEAKRRADARIRESIAAATRALVRRRGV